MATKFVRGLVHTLSGSPTSAFYNLKFIYEFWGFCVNGAASLTVPGGFAATTPVSMPANFTGGTSLLASGSDGATTATITTSYSGDAIFTSASAPFLSTMVGKILVTWKAASGSSEDSMYLITEFISTSQVKININTGGTPDPTTLHSSLTTRSSINFRVIDPTVAAATDTAGYIVIQLDPTGINTGQNNSQVQFRRAAANQLAATMSGTGSWTGSAFAADGYTTSELLPAGQTALSLEASINLIGDKDFLCSHIRSLASSTNRVIHLEIPKRLYSQTQDLHPITIMMREATAFVTTSTTEDFSGGFFMKTHSSDTLTGVTSARKHRTCVKATTGDGIPNVPGQSFSDFRYGFNTVRGTVVASDAILTLTGITNQFYLARCKLRKVKFTGAHVPVYHRIGTSGEFIQLTNSICWPWDNTITPHVLFPFGA